MTNDSDNRRRLDEELLIDFLMGACSDEHANEVTRRLGEDQAFSRLHDDLTNALGALRLADAPDPPADLVARTMDRISSQHKLDALLADEAHAPRRGGRTFSLREALSVAAAILLLVAAFMPSMVQARRRGQIQQCGAQLGRIGRAFNKYSLANDNVLPAGEQTNRRWMPADGEPVAGNSAGLFLLIRNKYADPAVFICPAVKTDAPPLEVRPEMTDFPSGQYIHFSYQYSIGGRRISLDDKRLAGVRQFMAILADSNPVFAEGRFNRDQVGASSGNHGHRGQNVLYLDMHVLWQKTPTVGVAGDNIYLVGENTDEYEGDEAPADETDSFLLPAYSGASSK